MKKYIFPLLLISPLTAASGLLLQEATMSQMGEQKTTVNAMALGLEMEYADNEDPAGNSTAETFMPTIGLFHVQQLKQMSRLIGHELPL